MRWIFCRKPSICRPERIFEELEPRIVLDASVDASWHDDLPGHHDVHGLLPQALTEDGPADWHAAETAAAGDHPDLNVVLISNALPEQNMLVNAASRHAQVVVFDAAKDNLDTINVRLHDMVESSGSKIDHLAVLDHAKAGEWRIGADRFNLFGLPTRRASFETLGSLLTDDGQIQLYGCELAGDPMGQALIDRIALYTHADVFASFDKVGGGSRHQDSDPSPVSASSMTQSPASVEAPPSHEPSLVAATVDTPRQPFIVNLGGVKLLHLGNSFAIDDTRPEQHITAAVTYDSDPDSSTGIRGLKLKNTAGSNATIAGSGHDAHPLTISGSVEDVNKVLRTMWTSTAADYRGEAHVTVATLDADSQTPVSSQTLTLSFPRPSIGERAQQSAPSHQEGNGDALKDSALSSLDSPFPGHAFRPGDPPAIGIEAAGMSVDVDETQTIPEIKVYDPGSRFVDVVLSASHGGLSAPNPLPHPGVEVRGNNGADEPVLRLSGFFDELNDTLKQVTYKPAQGYAGPDDLTVQVHSRGGYTNEIPRVPMVQETLPIEVVKRVT